MACAKNVWNIEGAVNRQEFWDLTLPARVGAGNRGTEVWLTGRCVQYTAQERSAFLTDNFD